MQKNLPRRTKTFPVSSPGCSLQSCIQSRAHVTALLSLGQFFLPLQTFMALKSVKIQAICASAGLLEASSGSDLLR